MMPKTIKFLLMSATAVALSGCATIKNGAYEKISVTSNPENALCRIYREGQGYLKAVASPGETYVMRDNEALTVTCSKAGYQTTSVVIGSEQKEEGAGLLNFVNFGAGFLADQGNHANKYLPDVIHVDMPLL